MRLFALLPGLFALSQVMAAHSFSLELFERQITCGQYPIGDGELFNETYLANITDSYMPPLFEDSWNTTGHIAKDLAVAFKPVIELQLTAYFKELEALAPNHTALFARKRVVNRRSFPWSTIGKVRTYTNETTGECSGVLVGRNLMMTASHCVPWGQRWRMQFIPAYDGEEAEPRPFGDAWALQCRGVRADEVNGRDYAVCQLDRSLGDRVGFMGWEASKRNRWYRRRTWTSVGYPLVFHDALAPAVEDSFRLQDVDREGSDGKRLESHVYAGHGWSGGPLFRVHDGMAYVAGVCSGYEKLSGPFGLITRKHTVNAGGVLLGRLITYGRKNWAP